MRKKAEQQGILSDVRGGVTKVLGIQQHGFLPCMEVALQNEELQNILSLGICHKLKNKNNENVLIREIRINRVKDWYWIWLEDDELIVAAADQVFYSSGNTEKAARYLEVNDCLRTDKKYLRISKIEHKKVECMSIEITVDGGENCFYVGKSGALTHNSFAQRQCKGFCIQYCQVRLKCMLGSMGLL